MKTIFIALFQGVEGKNILRTDIFKTIFSDPNVKIVFFTKSKERADNHRKEFNDPRITYEVVEKIQSSCLDKFFSRLKFLFLRTNSTRLQRKILREKRKNHFLYYCGEFFNWLLARHFFIRISRFLDYYFVKNNTFGKYFDKYNPDLVFLADLFEEIEIHFLREAKKRKVKTVAMINSWDRITTKCVFRLLPEKLIVFSDLLKSELIKHDAVKEDNIFVGGIPHYDFHFNAPYCSRKEFFEKASISEKNKILVYSPIGGMYGHSEWDMIDFLYNNNKKGNFGENVSVLVRFSPNDFYDEKEFKKRPYLIYDYPGKRFAKKRGIDWDMNFDELQHLSDTLYYMSLIVSYASSISIDASVLNKPIININFDKDSTPCHYKKDHYRKAVDVGGIRLVNNEKELIVWINKYLKNPEIDKEKRMVLAKQQCQFLDGKSGQRIGNFILSLI